jgi:asparagine synthase (glutamine-hydrolysing)
MCGIFALLNYHERQNSNINNNDVYNEFIKGKNRGPEFSVLMKVQSKLHFGFHRLAINGLNDESNQPILIKNSEDEGEVALICNGEIYNYKELYDLMDIKPTTDSDCEVIAHLYIKYGIQQTLTMLDGVFSFVLYDNRDENQPKVFVARDPYGVRPLYCIKYHNKNKDKHFFSTPINENWLIGFASELKCLSTIYNSHSHHYTVCQFPPGTYSSYIISNGGYFWKPFEEEIPYFFPSFPYNIDNEPNEYNNYYKQIAYFLQKAVSKRCLCTERPIACLLSGGLDSSLIAALVNKFYKDNNFDQQLETYSIGLAGSEDLKYAKIVSDYLGTKHTEIIVTEKEMFDVIPEVIHAIESYDTTTVRASIGNYLIGKYISQHSDAKVIFNGDGSDELLGGYLYMNKCPDVIEFDKEIRRLLKDIHLFDVLRSDKSISSHGLEPRTPFLDKNFVNFILSLPPQFRQHCFKQSHTLNEVTDSFIPFCSSPFLSDLKEQISNKNNMEKFILRNSFTQENFPVYQNGQVKQLLPDEILWRRKEAFSDGVTNKGRSLFTIIQEQISEKIVSPDGSKYPISIETEKFYYQKMFLEFYPNCLHILPYFWMPKYTNATDPSARTLDIYTA